MSMPSDQVQDFHVALSALRAEHEARDGTLKTFGDGDSGEYPVMLRRHEAEQVFGARIAVLEAELRKFGWAPITRVDPDAAEREREAQRTKALGQT